MQFHYFKPYSEINGEMLSLRYQETVTLESNWTFLARITLWNSILGTVFYFYRVFKNICRSKWPRGLRRSSATPRLLGLWVLIPPGVWKSVSCECCVLSGRDLCDGLITRPEESYRLWCVVGCELETSRMRRPWPIGGFRGKRIKIKNIWASYFYWTVRHFNSWRIKTNLMTLAIFIHFLCAQHVSDINISIIRSLRLFCWITTLVVLFLVRCVLVFRCGWVGVVSVLQAEAQLQLSRAQVERGLVEQVLSQPVHETATYMCDDTRGCVMQFWPPDDEHMCSKHVEAWNKLIVKQKFCASS